MARRANLSFGSLNPFGGGDQSFSAFNVGKSAVDASQEAYLQFQKVETDYQAGRVDDATYQAAFTTYQSSLKSGTSEAINAQARAESMAYSISRDQLMASISNGQATWSDLVAFDQSSLSGLNPGSAEYRDRYDRLNAAQTNEFRSAERQISADLDSGRMSYTQALEWYENVSQQYGGNYELSSQIGETIALVKNRIVGEKDNEILNGWKNDTLSLDALLAYAATAQAESPGTERAKTWEQNAKNAKTEAIGASLQYRYGLTEEYRDLALLVASVKPPTGNTSVSKAFQYYVDANGQWKSKVVYNSKSYAPSAAEQQAYKENKAKADQARIRMAEITKLIGTMPGGWVAEDDIIRNLADQQATLVKGSPGWLDLQKNIDYYNERKRSDEIMRQSGVIVSVPTTKSEKTAASNVSSFERPFGPGTGKVTIPATPKSGGGGGGGSGASAAQIKAANAAKAGLPTPPKGGFLWEALKPQSGYGDLATGEVVARSKGLFVTEVLGQGGPLNVAFRKTGVQGMASPDFQSLYAGMTTAIKEGETTWVNPSTGVAYVLPLDPTDRLALLDGLDANNVEQRRLEYITHPIKSTATAYDSAIRKANVNDLWVMNSPLPGIPAATPSYIRDSYLDADKGAAPISAALTYMNRAEFEAGEWGKYAQKALEQGNYEQAWAYLRRAQASFDDTSGLARQASSWASGAQKKLEILAAQGAKIPKTGDLAQDIKTMQSIGDADPEGAWLTSVMGKSGLDDVAKFFVAPADPSKDPFIRNAQTGQPQVNEDGSFKLGPGWVRQLVGDDKLELKRLPMTFNPMTNKMESADPTMVLVQLQTNTGFVPVMAPFKLEDVGLLVDASGQKSAIASKVVRINWNGQDYIMAQDPMDPRRWLPLNDNGMTFNLPAGATVMKGSSKLGVTGSQVNFTATGADGKKNKYTLAQDEKGQYGIYKTDKDGNFTGEVIEVGSVAASELLASAGVGLDIGQLSADQKTYLNSGLGGIHIGDANRIAIAAAQLWRSQYGLPYTTPATAGRGTNRAQPSSLGSQLPKAPATTTVTTVWGGTKTVGTGQTPAPTNRPYVYEGAGGTNMTPSIPTYQMVGGSLIQAPGTTATTPKGTPILAATTGFTLPTGPAAGPSATPYIAPSSLTQVPKTPVYTGQIGRTPIVPKTTPVIKPPPSKVNTNPVRL